MVTWAVMAPGAGLTCCRVMAVPAMAGSFGSQMPLWFMSNQMVPLMEPRSASAWAVAGVDPRPSWAAMTATARSIRSRRRAEAGKIRTLIIGGPHSRERALDGCDVSQAQDSTGILQLLLSSSQMGWREKHVNLRRQTARAKSDFRKDVQAGGAGEAGARKGAAMGLRRLTGERRPGMGGRAPSGGRSGRRWEGALGILRPGHPRSRVSGSVAVSTGAMWWSRLKPV